MKYFFKLIVCVLSLHSYTLAAPLTSKTLNDYFATAQSISANFTQSIKQDNQAVAQESKGTLLIGKQEGFRWDYLSPDEQVIVSNGEKLWHYDKALAQVTVQKVDQQAQQAPLALLMGQSPITAHFVISVKQDLFTLTPKQTSQELQNIQIELSQGKTLKRIVINDQLGNATTITLSHVKLNQPLPRDIFRFTAPAGVDVVGE